ncbi:MAG: hypothetical protein U1E50_15250 [Caulobacteraceae bacterium]
MSKALSRVSLLASILAGGALAVSTPLHAQEVRGLEVEGRAPTSVVLHVDGLSYAEVRSGVRRAAATVCDNAVGNGELDQIDRGWCQSASADKAMGRYRTSLRLAARGEYASGAPPVVVAMR